MSFNHLLERVDKDQMKAFYTQKDRLNSIFGEEAALFILQKAIDTNILQLLSFIPENQIRKKYLLNQSYTSTNKSKQEQNMSSKNLQFIKKNGVKMQNESRIKKMKVQFENDEFAFKIQQEIDNEECALKIEEEDRRNQQLMWELRQNEEEANEKLTKLMLGKEESLQNKRKQEELKISDCGVCSSEIEMDDIGYLECNHIFHRTCISQYLKKQINDQKLSIKCPLKRCHLISYNDVKEYSHPEDFDIFDKNILRQYLTESSSSMCPTIGCETVYELVEGVIEYDCSSCHIKYCLLCKTNHEGMTCFEYQKHDNDDKSKISQKQKRCLKCKTEIKRIPGCSILFCEC